MVTESSILPGEMALPLPGYGLRQGSTLDRALLLKTMRRTYQELYPQQRFDHLAQTLDAYFSAQTPLWWVELEAGPVPGTVSAGMPSAGNPPQPDPEAQATPANPQEVQAINATTRRGLVGRDRPASVGCLWMGTATDQVTGLRHAHIFLLYVHPQHRRRGLGRALMLRAEAWAQERGDRQISLQVFEHNGAALNLYQGLGYQPQSIALVKRLDSAG